MIPLPSGWTEHEKGWHWPLIREGLFAFCLFDAKRLEYYLAWPFLYFLKLHERGHAWGIKSCDNPSCLMYEGEVDGWAEKSPLRLLRVLWRRLSSGHWYCGRCEQHLKFRGALK